MKNFKNVVLIGTALTILICLILFVAGALSQATFNIADWSQDCRTGISITFVVLTIFAWVIPNVIED